ncbi:L,D-transpeptidase family protein [Haloferula sp. A504]|uniref:L,D-transpeptidase family protein n=1 Tax=Haloferula sp. A504 TaxID=3373601 RepID=UPI0031BD03E7|nr:L,D-transpeptidase [Verrucomicrobiaceae bacterium E54]
MHPNILRNLLFSLLLVGGGMLLSSCGGGKDTRNKMLVSVRDQRMLLVRDGKPVKSYAISTSKFGLGSQQGSNRTPLGRMEVAKKIGSGEPKGMVFKSRRPTGEILKPNAPGRDPIVSRIMWLSGKDWHNKNTFRRLIYIHGTPEEWRLGRPASYGCIRMGMKDVVDLYDRVGEGAEVRVFRGSLLQTSEGREYVNKNRGAARLYGLVSSP